MASKEIRHLIKLFGNDRKQWIPRTREGFYPLLNELGYRVGAEVGVFRGANAEQILMNNPEMNLHLIDPYRRRYFTGNTAKRWTTKEIKAHAKKRLSKVNRRFGCSYNFMKQLSHKAVEKFSNGSLDFVYIDANHSYKSVKEDLRLWTPKVRIGGIIGGHDYNPYSRKRIKGVVRAVNRFVKKNEITPLFITTEAFPSFFFIKEREYA